MALTITKHGGTSHLVRPDGVYATGVVQPTGNYQPALDSQLVAQEFADSGQLAPASLNGLRRATLLGQHGQQLQLLAGLRGANINFFTRIKLWLQGAASKAKAATAVRAAIAAQAAATGQTKAEAKTQLFNTAIAANYQSGDYPGSSPAGASTTAMADYGAALVAGGGAQTYNSYAPVMSAQDAAAAIAPQITGEPAALAQLGSPYGRRPSGGRAVAVGNQNAIARFYRARQGRIR